MYILYIFYTTGPGLVVFKTILKPLRSSLRSHTAVSMTAASQSRYSLCRLGDQKNAELSAGHFAIVALKPQ